MEQVVRSRRFMSRVKQRPFAPALPRLPTLAQSSPEPTTWQEPQACICRFLVAKRTLAHERKSNQTVKSFQAAIEGRWPPLSDG